MVFTRYLQLFTVLTFYTSLLIGKMSKRDDHVFLSGFRWRNRTAHSGLILELLNSGLFLELKEKFGEVLGQLRGTTVPVNAAVVIDMLGNSSSRWKQEDGTLATAVKLGSGYHMPGEVTVCNDETFKKLIGIVAPFFSLSAGLSKIVIPPLPRYVFDTCCSQDTHCTNVRGEKHASEILNKADHLRNVMKGELNRLGVPNFRVTEGWTSIQGVKYPSREENVSALRHLTTADGVHFTRDGYENLANAIRNTVTSKDKIAAVDSRAGNGRRGTFFWRRFISPNGSTRPKFSSAGYSANKRTRPQLHKSNNKRGRKI
jgi:hypothetical protein